MHVLITGSSTGIGRACALYLARRGFSVLAAVRRESDGQALEKEAGSSLKAIVLDVADSQSIAHAAQVVKDHVGAQGLGGLVNNAGIGVFGPVEFVEIENWRKQFEVNVFGQIAVTQAMLPLLRQAVATAGPWKARIVMIGSIAGKISQPISAPYCASKFAIEAICDTMRVELKNDFIHTCLIEPGAVKSEIWRKAGDTASAYPSDGPARQRYGTLIDAVAATAKKASDDAIPADEVARVLQRCLTATTPTTRVIVGRDAKMGGLLKWLLPDRWFDRAIAKAFGV